MLDSALTSIYANSQSLASQVTSGEFLVCCLASIVLGIVCAFVYMFRHDHSKNFVVTLALLPLIVQMVITLVNGNLGVGIAVMGVFNLVRFRSIPGSAKDIGSVFLAMAIGLATGMGYVVLAAVFFLVVAGLLVLLTALNFGGKDPSERILRITIPENLDYDGLFDDLFARYARSFTLEKVKTSNMGTLYELQYRIVLKDSRIPKAFFDELRCRNGNLNIVCSRESSGETL